MSNMSKLAILRARIRANNIKDAIGEVLNIVNVEIVPARGEDGFTAAIFTDIDGIPWRTTSASFVDLADNMLDVMGEGPWDEPVGIMPKVLMSKRNREYLSFDFVGE